MVSAASRLKLLVPSRSEASETPVRRKFGPQGLRCPAMRRSQAPAAAGSSVKSTVSNSPSSQRRSRSARAVRIERRARLRAHRAPDRGRRQSGAGLEDELRIGIAGVARRWRSTWRAQAASSTASRRSGSSLLARGFRAALDQLGAGLEVEQPPAFDPRPQDDVGTGERPLDLAPGEDVEGLGEDAGDRIGPLASGERLAEVDGDHDLGAHRARGVDRQVGDHAAVDQQPAVALDRREQAGHRHAGAQRAGEVATVEHHRLAVGGVGGDRAEGQRQAVEVVDADGAQGEQAQLGAEPVAADHARRQSSPRPRRRAPSASGR